MDSNESSPESTRFPDKLLKLIFPLVESHQDRNSVSLVCKDWYEVERLSRTRVFIGNCYSVSPDIVVRRFPNIKSVTLKGKPRFSDFNLVPDGWGADVESWVTVFASECPSLEELRLKRMVVTDESLELIASSFANFQRLSLSSCDGFSTDGLAAIAAGCKNLVELDIQENGIEDKSGDWLSYFPEDLISLEVLNFASLNTDISFDALQRLVGRCKTLKILKVSKNISLEQLGKLLACAPQLTELGTGSFSQEITTAEQFVDIETAFSNISNLHSLSGLWEVSSLNLPFLFPVCPRLTFLNLSYAALLGAELAELLTYCPHLRRLWVMDSVEDEGLEAVGSNCPLLEELRVFPANPFNDEGVTEAGLIAVSYGCPKLHYLLYFCRQMTNAAVETVVNNCPDFTHFRLCIMTPQQPDCTTNEPMDKAFKAVAKTCKKLKRLSVSGLLTDLTFEYIGKYAKNLEFLSVAFAGSSDKGMQCILEGCPKLRKLEIRDSPFGNAALLSGSKKYENMRSLWMSACNVTIDGCKKLAMEMSRLNVEVINEEDETDAAEKVYVYRSVAGRRMDAPPFVYAL